MLVRVGAVAALFALGAGVLPGATPGHSAREGGVFRVAGVPDAIDPAISLDAGDALSATCALLMHNPDKPLPEGTRLVPEVAARYPDVSRDGRTYTFTIRKGFRFATGEAVTAASFARQIERVLDPKMRSAWIQYAQDIVGAGAVQKGKATRPSGVVTRGNKLIVRLTHAASDFPARTTFPGVFCAVPTDLPISPEGVGAPLPGAGPYTITEFVPGQKLVLERNPFYRGSRPHHVDEIDYVSAPDNVKAVRSGAADYAELSSPADVATLPRRFRSQLHSVPGIGIRYVVLNSSQPLFKDNASLRRAVNFALDRRALLAARGGAITGSPTDQYLSPSMPGYVDADIYPLKHPNLRKAKALAAGHARSGRAMLYIKDTPIDIAQAQIIQRDLKRIGLIVKVKKFPGPALFQRFFTPGSPYDMSLLGFGPDYWDPYAILNVLFDGRLIGTPYSLDIGYFDSPRYNSALSAASKLRGSARYRAYGRLDVDVARNAAPMVAYESESALTFVSKRVGCLVLNPFLDFAAVCLK
jgi:peptide/nickel transport system substrate-binding protein